jgi:hypothetical protein
MRKFTLSLPGGHARLVPPPHYVVEASTMGEAARKVVKEFDIEDGAVFSLQWVDTTNGGARPTIWYHLVADHAWVVSRQTAQAALTRFTAKKREAEVNPSVPVPAAESAATKGTDRPGDRYVPPTDEDEDDQADRTANVANLIRQALWTHHEGADTDGLLPQPRRNRLDDDDPQFLVRHGGRWYCITVDTWPYDSDGDRPDYTVPGANFR